MYNLKIISSTARPGRKGPIIADWIAEAARQDGRFQVEVLDLGEVNLPLMNESSHPVLKSYEHEHTKNWSAKIEEAEAFIFVTAEYNSGYPAPLKNALEYLYLEWNYKAAGIVSYGGVSAGTRAASYLKNDLATYKMVPIFEMVNIPFFMQHMNDLQEFTPNEITQKAAQSLFNELARWSKGLKSIRESNLVSAL